MHLSKKQLIILGAIAVLFLGFLIFLGSCNKRLAVPKGRSRQKSSLRRKKRPRRTIRRPSRTRSLRREASRPPWAISPSRKRPSMTKLLPIPAGNTLSFDKSRIQACRVEGETRQAALFTFQYQPIDATIHYFDTDTNAWVSEPLAPGAYGRVWSRLNFPPAQVCFLISRRRIIRKKMACSSMCLTWTDTFLSHAQRPAGQLKLVSSELREGQALRRLRHERGAAASRLVGKSELRHNLERVHHKRRCQMVL